MIQKWRGDSSTVFFPTAFMFHGNELSFCYLLLHCTANWITDFALKRSFETKENSEQKWRPRRCGSWRPVPSRLVVFVTKVFFSFCQSMNKNSIVFAHGYFQSRPSISIANLCRNVPFSDPVLSEALKLHLCERLLYPHCACPPARTTEKPATLVNLRITTWITTIMF